MKYFVGLDVSLSNTGLCIIDQKGKVKLLTSKQTKLETELVNDRINRCSYLGTVITQSVQAVATELCKDHIGCVAIESYSFASKGRLAQLIEAGYAVRSCFWDTKMIEVAPIQLKKFILGKELMKKAKGKEAKSIMIREVFKKYGLDIDNDDENDAFLLANIALLYYNVKNKNKPKDMFKYQEEVIEALIKKEEGEWQRKLKRQQSKKGGRSSK
jgi:Holliday junction resolvasome RuvABC endonuclease subunit